MKKIFKMPGIIFLLAVICFVMATCEEDESIGSKVNVSGSSLARKIEWVQSHRSSGTTYTIDVTADEEISGYELTSGSNRNMTIILNGNGKTISLKNDAAKWLFMIGDYVTLVLNNIALKGHDHNRASLVMVVGTLIMNDGTKIIGNKILMNDYNEKGGGVWVKPHGTLTMNGGEISDNSAPLGEGVYVGGYGVFIMNGGKISDGSVYLDGAYHSAASNEWYAHDVIFTMNGGEISGVSVNRGGIFTMNGGKISGSNSSGVYLDKGGTFTMSGGKISGNTASSGGGVYVRIGTFTMSGGEISGNTAGSGGGVYMAFDGVFIISGGKISGNTAGSGGGVYGLVTMSGGEISGNTASGSSGISYGGGVCGGGTMSGGKIYGNTVTNTSTNTSYSNGSSYGGGVYSGGTNFTMSGGEIYGNTASGTNTSYGGGVCAHTFRITNGTVYGSNTLDDHKNTAAVGSALGFPYGSGSTAQYGTFNGDTWISNGNLTATDNTIRVENGVLK
jgi:hypothetical protein